MTLAKLVKAMKDSRYVRYQVRNGYALGTNGHWVIEVPCEAPDGIYELDGSLSNEKMPAIDQALEGVRASEMSEIFVFPTSAELASAVALNNTAHKGAMAVFRAEKARMPAADRRHARAPTKYGAFVQVHLGAADERRLAVKYVRLLKQVLGTKDITVRWTKSLYDPAWFTSPKGSMYIMPMWT